MAKTTPDDDDAAPSKPSPASKQASGMEERLRIVEEYVTSLREVLRRLLNKLH
ncbi:MAG: hypothetical protein ACXWCS_28060 [Burkholderiales bacterium]